MPNILVTGASGFFGGLLKQRLLSESFTVTNVDLIADPDQHDRLTSVQADIVDRDRMRELFRAGGFSAVIHCAAMLAHGSVDPAALWATNVEGTRVLADCCREFGVGKLVFLSTNCLWAQNLGHPVTEEEVPCPIEPYGRSKLAAEQLLAGYGPELSVTILRCPTIIESGRLGLLAILFEFIQEGRTVWVVGGGSNRYQFVYAQDLASACILALDHGGFDIFHVGSDNVKSIRENYESVIREAKSSSRVRSLPKAPTIAAMRLTHLLKVSPLGPYHSQMIAEDFIFDTEKIRHTLHWAPTLTNEEMLLRAYRYYASRQDEIHARRDDSPHRSASPMGIIRLLKWLS